MQDFKLFQATSISEAVSVLDQYNGKAKLIAGGTDLLSRNKNLVTMHLPQVMVDITTIPNLNYIKRDADGLRIGPMALINDVATNAKVMSDFNIISQASDVAASPQIKNIATVVGDVLQETWCWYLRYDYPCWRNGGNVCYGAIGDNRYYHSIFGGRLCYATQQSDIAPALESLDARATIQGPSGSRTVTIDQLLPGITMINGVVKADSLAINEMVTEIFVPNTFANAKGNFTKIRVRPSWDFALASAAVVKSSNDARITLGGVDVQPRRFRAGEDMLRGQTVTQSLANSIGDAAVQGAVSLAMNAFRVDLLRTAVKRAVMAVA
jgi:xanthine dehydrogenase YagS FAD-binding subunit